MKKNSKKLFLTVFCLFAVVFFSQEEIINKDNEKQVNNENLVDKSMLLENGDFEVSFLDVGQADSILIKNKDKYMLIDAGNNEDGSLLVDYFKNLNIEKFTYVFATHAHEDHIGGMDDIINNFAIDNFYMPDVVTTTKTFEDVLDALEENDLYFDTPNIDDELSFEDASIKVLSVGSDDSDLNNTSIVLKLTYKNVSFLFMGDATSEVEKNILNKDISSDVLKVGHHGSKYSSLSSFLKKVNPRYAVISVGKNNSYDHPGQVVLDRLEKLNVDIYRTDEKGTIIFTTDGDTLQVKTIKTNTNGN